jgi:phosphoribosyl 1,2-cyclic phosphodiesterase
VIRVKHPSFVLGYRIRIGGRTICFIPDNEIEGDGSQVGPDWDRRLREFVRGADLLIHDSMYTDREYPSRKGWGHSTFEQSLRLAREGGVKKLLLFHHDPTRTDAQLDEIVARLQDEAGRGDGDLVVEAAREEVYYEMGD